MPVAKIGTSRKMVIPKEVYDQLGLSPGDYVDMKVRNSTVVMKRKPKLDGQLDQARKDYKEGRYLGPFDSADEAMRALHKATQK